MKAKSNQYRTILIKYLPAEFIDDVVQLLIDYPVVFKIVKPRKTKLGDFRAGLNEDKHRITVNGDLNPYSFLITTLHEFAHLITFMEHGRRVAAHGTEWKRNYSLLIIPIINSENLPSDIESVLTSSLVKVKASSCSDLNLHRTLMRYNPLVDNKVPLEALDKNSIFALNGKTFRKGNLRRTRFICTEVGTQRDFLVSALAQVTEIKDEQ